MRSSLHNHGGFTLIEVMISSAIFIVIVLVGTTALITATNNYRASSEIRQSMDTLAFVMEDMTRNIRLGTAFHCSSDLSDGSIEGAAICPSPSGTPGQSGSFILAMEAFNGSSGVPSDQVIYAISGNKLYKKSKDSTGVSPQYPPNAAFAQITPDDVVIDMAKSGFVVNDVGSGTQPLVPAVTVRLAGSVSYHSTFIPFDVQATIAPRNIPN